MDEKIREWNNLLDKYFLLEGECIKNLNIINSVRTNLKIKITHQNKDNIIFYNSIIDNSYSYLSMSLKIRQIKFIKDLNKIYTKIYENKEIIPKIVSLHKQDIENLINDFNKLNDEIIEVRKNNTAFKWVKDEITENLQEIEKTIDDTINYHIKLIDFLSTSIRLETDFYFFAS